MLGFNVRSAFTLAILFSHCYLSRQAIVDSSRLCFLFARVFGIVVVQSVRMLFLSAEFPQQK